jgi:hypothetical protein
MVDHTARSKILGMPYSSRLKPLIGDGWLAARVRTYAVNSRLHIHNSNRFAGALGRHCACDRRNNRRRRHRCCRQTGCRRARRGIQCSRRERCIGWLWRLERRGRQGSIRRQRRIGRRRTGNGTLKLWWTCSATGDKHEAHGHEHAAKTGSDMSFHPPGYRKRRTTTMCQTRKTAWLDRANLRRHRPADPE